MNSSDKEQFYPTPTELAKELFAMGGSNRHRHTNILEPSAGTGSLVDVFKSTFCCNGAFIHCIEPNPERQATLKGKGYPVVADDFLSFDPLTRYSTIILNPPFHSGAKHLKKALEICEEGGRIYCILNADTIKNPCTNERKALLAELEKQSEFECRFKTQAFSHAERRTDVEVALLYIEKKTERDSSFCPTFENFRNRIAEEYEKKEKETSSSMTRHGEINQLIDLYRAEVRSALSIHDEILSFNHLFNQTSKKDEESVVRPFFEVNINGAEGSDFPQDADIVRAVSRKYWKMLLFSKELSSLLTEDARGDYWKKLEEMADYEFNERNILQLKQELCQNLLKNLDSAIMKVFSLFTSRYCLSEYSQNIHYYNGWKTNQAFAVNKKVIIPLFGNTFDKYSGRMDMSYSSRTILNDIEKVMNYLDCGRTDSDAEMTGCIEKATRDNHSRDIDTKFFTISVFKKGTCHLVFKDMALLKKFNLYAGKKNQWLPDGYGSKPYSSLNDEERSVVDSFEGMESYEDTYRDRGFYVSGSGIPLLRAAV